MKRDTRKPSVSLVRGSKATKSPTLMPLAKVSSLEELSISSLISVECLSLESVFSLSSSIVWTLALFGKTVPVTTPFLVYTLTSSPSSDAYMKPPMFSNSHLPLSLTLETIPPSVST